MPVEKSDVDLSKYTRVEPEKENKDEVKKGEVMVRKTSATRAVISQTIHLLTKEDDVRSIVMKARGQAVSKAVAIAEIVKRRVPGLHQIVKLDCGEMTQTYKLKEGETGEPEISKTKFVTGIELCLSLDELDKTHIGYQEPLPEHEVEDERDEKKGGKGASKGGPKGGSGGRGAGGRGGAASKGGRGGGRGATAAAGRGAPAGRGSSGKGAKGSKGSSKGGRGGAKGGRGGDAR
ncbi:hypothetical protein DIPPA_30351 [Diplonema papillatum]|nr:hypothetical protein DIPPA_30351 [Diplonema papillatum]